MTELPRMMAGANWIDAHQEAKLLKVEEQIKNINVDHSFHSSWRTNTTFDDLCTDIVNDATAKIGMTFLGGVNCSGLPEGVSNAELLVEVINSTVSGEKVLHFECYSANVSPYLWTKTYWKQTSSIVQTPWVGQPEVAPELSLGSDQKTSNLNNMNTNLFKTSHSKPFAKMKKIVDKLEVNKLIRKKYSQAKELDILRGNCSTEESMEYAEYVAQCKERVNQ